HGRSNDGGSSVDCHADLSRRSCRQTRALTVRFGKTTDGKRTKTTMFEKKPEAIVLLLRFRIISHRRVETRYRQHILPVMKRRTFLEVSLAGAAGVLTGGLPKIIAAASTSKGEETFLLGGDVLVNRLGFGAMRLTGEGIWGWPPDRENAKKVLRRAVELGVNFIDTADAYGPETNELLIAEALYPYPKGLVIATKGGSTRPSPGQWVPDGRPEYLAQCVDKSLKRLKLERIDLWQ